jgi:malonyl-CoA O-methyltransferase
MTFPVDDRHADARHIRRVFSRAARSYDAAAHLARRIGSELVGRLDVVRLQPKTVIDIGTGTGHCARLLEARYRRARVIGIDSAAAMTREAAAQRRWRSRQRYLVAAAERLPMADATAQLAVSNLALMWSDCRQVFPELHRVLAPGGLLMFTTLGPDTLQELRAAWQTVDSMPHTHPFLDMHILGDALIESGFAEPVMDVERVVVTYPSHNAALSELKRCGWQNVSPQRRWTLTGRNRFEGFVRAYESYCGADGRWPLTFEVVYGHAWASAAPALPRRSVTVGFDQSGVARRG